MQNYGPKNFTDIGEGWKPTSFYVGEGKMFKTEEELDNYLKSRRDQQHKALDLYFNLNQWGKSA